MQVKVRIFAYYNTELMKDIIYGGTWIVCDGRAVNPEEYPILFGRIGYHYGREGDNFKIPNLKGRVVACLTESEMGYTEGSKTHTLTIAEMPNHNHENGPFDRLLKFDGKSTASGNVDNGYILAEPNLYDSAVILSSGGSEAHNNMQPTIYLAYFIYCI